MALTRVRAEQILDIDFKQAVRVLSSTNVAGLVTSAPSVVDSVALSLNDRILVSGQLDASQNGLYRVAVVGTGSNGEWVRTSDSNTTGEINAGMIVMVTEGYLYADTLWKLITDNPIVIGTTELEFVLNSQASFDVINANGTPVSANTISSTINYLPGNNMVINGVDIDDSVTFAVSDSPNFAGNITGQGNLFISRDVSITGNLTIGANLNVVNVNEYVGATGNISFLGNLLPGTSNVQNYSLGLPGQPWSDVYVANLNVAVYSIDNLEVTTDATIVGNLTVLGTTTTINSNVIVTNDLNIDLANNQSTFGNVNGAGLLVGNVANAPVLTWQYNYAANSWTTNVGITAVGNVSGNYIYGNGAFLTDINAGNITGAYGNANVADYLPAYTGNITAGNISVSGNIAANYYVGNGSQLTGVATSTQLSNTDSNVSNLTTSLSNTNSNVANLVTITTNTNSNIANLTSDLSNTNSNVSNLSNSLSNTNNNVSNLVTITTNTNSNIANLSSSLSNTNSNVTNLTSSLSNTNSNVANLSNSLSTTNNNVSNLVTITTNTNSNVANLTSDLSNTNSNVSNLTTALSNTNSNVSNIASNVTTLQGQVYANANVAAYLPTYTGNVAGNYFIGNGSQLTGIAVASVSGTAATVTANAQPNITSVGTLSALSVTGNVTGNYFIGNGSQLTGTVTLADLANTNSNVSNLTSSLSNTNSNVGNLSNALASTNSNVGNLTTITTNTDSNVGNLSNSVANTNSNVSNLSSSLSNTNSNVSNVAANVTTLQGQVYANANVAAYLPTYTGNIAAGIISVNGNVTGNYFIGNGSQLTGLPAQYGNSNVAAYLPTYTGNVAANNLSVTTQANVGTLYASSGASVTGTMTATYANAQFVNQTNGAGWFSAAGNIYGNNSASITGNISANYYLGNGSQLIGVATSTDLANSNSNISNLSSSLSNTNSNVSNVAANVTTLQGQVYTNSNVAAYLPTYTGNLSAGNISVSGNVNSNFFIGNGSQLTGLVSVSGTAATVTASAQPNITSVGILSTLSVTGNITTGNLLISSRGSIGIAPQAEIHVAANGSDTDGNGSITNPYRTITYALASASSGSTIVVHPGGYTEDVTVNNLSTVAITAAQPGAASPQTYVINGNVTVSGTSSSILLHSIGVVGSIVHSSSGSLFVTAIQMGTGGNSTTFSKTGTGYLEVTNGNWSGGTPAVSITGAGPVTFNGVQLTNLTVNNANASVLLRNLPSAVNTTLTSGTLTIIASSMYGNSNTAPAITTVAGTLNIQNSLLLRANNTAGTMTVGAATAYLYDDIFFDRTNSTLSGVPISGTAFAPPAEFQAVRADSISVTSNVVATGNVVGGNIRTVGLITATGNITGNFFIGNGSQLTGITSTYGNANVAAYLPTYTGNVAAGNVVTDNIISSGNIVFTGNLLPSANIYTLGSVASPWADATFGPQSINILDTTSNVANTVVIQNDAGNITMGTAGFEIQTLGTGTSVFRIAALTGQIFSNAQTIIANTVNSANATSGSLQTAGGAGIAKDLYVGGNVVTANLSVSGNVYSNPTYGAFSDTTTQTNTSVGNAIAMRYNTVDLNNGITIASNSRITINKTGVYNIQFSAQLVKTDSGSDQVLIWLDKNGTAVPNSATSVWLQGNNAKQVAAWNWVVSATANDYYRLMWLSPDSDVSILAEAAAGAVPAIPSVILTVVPVGP